MIYYLRIYQVKPKDVSLLTFSLSTSLIFSLIINTLLKKE